MTTGSRRRPRGVQAGDGWGRVGEHGVVDRDDRRVPPRRRHGSAGDDDDAAPELARTGDGHARPVRGSGRAKASQRQARPRVSRGAAVTMPMVPSSTT